MHNVINKIICFYAKTDIEIGFVTNMRSDGLLLSRFGIITIMNLSNSLQFIKHFLIYYLILLNPCNLQKDQPSIF